MIFLLGMTLSTCSEKPMYMKSASHTYICKMGCQNYPSLWKGKDKIKLWRPYELNRRK
jgi:hypothetical protein